MLAHVVLSSALVSSSFAALIAPARANAAADPLITPAPRVELLRKQNSADYMGWLRLAEGEYTDVTCSPGYTYFQTASQWACCSVGGSGCYADMAIGCFSGSMIYRRLSTGTAPVTNSFFTVPCTSIWTDATDSSFTLCNTAFMYENDVDNSPKSNIVCGAKSSLWSYYRQRPADATRSPSSIQLPSIPPLATPVPSIPTGNSNPTTSPTLLPPSGGEEKSESKAWIAGAVVGPIVGLALIGFGIFFFMRRKKNKNSQHVAPATGSMPAPGATAYQQNTYPSNQGSPQPPQYFPNMQQNATAAPFGAPKQDNTYYAPGPQSPVAQQSPQSPYGASPQQQWQQPGGQPVYGGVPSPTMSPQPQHVQPAAYQTSDPRPFSSELEASHGTPEMLNVQPKN